MFNSVMACTGVIICLAALIFGLWRERAGALIYIMTYGVCLLLETIWPLVSLWVYLGANGLSLIALYPLCWKAAHPWPIWAIGASLLAFTGDILALSHAHSLGTPGIGLVDLTGFAFLISLAAGTFAVWKRRDKSKKLGIFSYE